MNDGILFLYPFEFSGREKTKVEERGEKRVTKGWQSHMEVLNKPASG